MNFLCPSCRTPLPRGGAEAVTCTGCGVAVDLARVETAPGQARLWPEVDLSGEALGGYALVRLLGSGGMGTVYEARAPDGAVVALKVLAPLLAAEPALRERFRREARALAAISHPGVVKMLGDGEERGFCWYAMERVDGVDLRARLTKGPLPPQEVLALARAVLDALEAVHGAGFVHRDVKPSNLLLSPSGPKLCDFGIARVDGASTLTESAAMLGSLRYMAPEQRWGKCDARSDLYALGVVLHEALARGVPGEQPLPPGTPSSLARFIEQLTQASPARRPGSAAAAKRLLARAPARAAGLVTAAVLLVGVVGGGVAVQQLRVATVAEAEVDAGVPAMAQVEVAKAPEDAGSEPAQLAAAPAIEDAGAAPEVDSGLAIALAPPVKVPGPKGKPVKPVSKLAPLPKFDPEVVAKQLAGPPGRVIVTGQGRAGVTIRGAYRGLAPGTFSTELGTFQVQLRCERAPTKSKKKPALAKQFDFEVSLTEAAPSRTLEFDCST